MFVWSLRLPELAIQTTFSSLLKAAVVATITICAPVVFIFCMERNMGKALRILDLETAQNKESDTSGVNKASAGVYKIPCKTIV